MNRADEMHLALRLFPMKLSATRHEPRIIMVMNMHDPAIGPMERGRPEWFRTKKTAPFLGRNSARGLRISGTSKAIVLKRSYLRITR